MTCDFEFLPTTALKLARALTARSAEFLWVLRSIEAFRAQIAQTPITVTPEDGTLFEARCPAWPELRVAFTGDRRTSTQEYRSQFLLLELTLDLDGEVHDLGLVRLHLETPAPRPGRAEQYFCSEISGRHRKYPEFELIYELTEWLACMATWSELSAAEQAELGELYVDLAFGLGRQLGPLNADQVRDLMRNLNRTWDKSLRGDEVGLVQVESKSRTTEALVVCRPGSAEVTLITPAGWVRFRGDEARSFERLIQTQDALQDLEDERRDLHGTFAEVLGALNARKLRAGGTLKRTPSRRVRDTAA